MNLRDYKAGTYIQQNRYQSFIPEKINHVWVWDDPVINVLLEEATKKLGELNAFSIIVPDIDLFIRMHIVKEATTSSRIEGTKTDIDEALMEKEDIVPEKRDDWQEVQNYIKAMNYAIEELARIPLSNRLLREIHKILLESARGEHRQPGEFRTSQNWIGGSSLKDAVYIPPVHTEVPDLMGDLEKFLHNEELNVPRLIKIAIAHYQFESIHPFLDGNGRIGRLLITLYLMSAGLLIKPSLYISDFFERNRPSYYDGLSRVRESNDMAHWIKFFLSAVITTAEKGNDRFLKILALRNEVDGKIFSLKRKAESGRQLMQLLYKQPIINGSQAAEYLKMTPKNVNALLGNFEQLSILTETSGQKRNRVYVFDRYLKCFM